MTRFDLTPLYKSTVGFDRLASLMDQLGGFDEPSGFPPYNIERLDDNDYRITMAVAGFGDDDLNVEVKENTLTITGTKQSENRDEGANYLHQGIAARSFERRFQLADHVTVSGAELKNGLLHVDLVREIPEAMKPRTIAISNGNGSEAQIIDQS